MRWDTRLVVTAHRTYPGLPLLLRAQASRHTLDELILELVGADGPCRKRANALFSDKRGNIRAVLAALYDDFACNRLATAVIEERKRPGIMDEPGSSGTHFSHP